MITFCPVPDENAIAKLLDDKRLNAQRTESGAILKWLRDPGRYARFQSAGFCVMWVYNLEALAVYYNAMLREWLRRGFSVDRSKFEESVLGRENEVEFPGWWRDTRVHSNHRIALLTKLPEHYGKLGWTEQPAPDGDYNYIWPEWNPEAAVWELRPPKAGTSTPKSASRALARKQAKVGRRPAKRKQRAGQDAAAREAWQDEVIHAGLQQGRRVWRRSLSGRSTSTAAIDLDLED